MHQAEWRAVEAMKASDSTSSGYMSPHSSVCIPPSEPPTTSRTFRTPSRAASSRCTRTMSRTVMSGKVPW